MSATPAQTRSRRRVTAAVVGLLWAVTACAPGPSQTSDAIDREVFIETYVDLRLAALDSSTGVIDDEARADVLSRHGVTADDLLSFADLHGRDVDFMRDVWNDVELRLDALRPEAPEPARDSAR